MHPLIQTWASCAALCSAIASLGAQPADLSERLEAIRAEHDLPALAGLVTTAEETVAQGAVGVRMLGDPATATTDDLWHLGSCTKSMTATLAAVLVERGVIAWETTIGEMFGEEFPDLHEGYRDATLAQLLCHRGGCPTAPPAKAWAEARKQEGTVREQRDAFVRAVLGEAPAYEPGAQYVYSNQGTTVAGAMLERAWDASGASAAGAPALYEDMLIELLFTPLGITTAGFGSPGSADSVDQPRGHAQTLQLTPLKAIAPGPYSDNPPAISPAGRAHMSMEDWARYIREHLRGRRGESELLSREVFERLHTDAFGGEYAYGWGAVEREWGGNVIAHSGSNTMWYCVVWAAPERGFAVLVATNRPGDVGAAACDEAAGALIGAFTSGEFD